MRKETKLAFDLDDLAHQLGLPKTTVIISVFSQEMFTNPRQIVFQISAEEKDLEEYISKVLDTKIKKAQKE